MHGHQARSHAELADKRIVDDRQRRRHITSDAVSDEKSDSSRCPLVRRWWRLRRIALGCNRFPQSR
jgi:hypothetical protein